MTRPIGVGIVGLGFMGRTHLDAYRAARDAGRPNVINGVYDADTSRLRGTQEAVGNLQQASSGELPLDADTAIHESIAELFANDAVELVSICTPTDTHVDLACAALDAGKHVLLEKPVALRSEEAQRLASAQEASDRICMPAMCMRFWPGWDWLRAAVAEERYGSVLSASFHRLASPPAWNPGFYRDTERSGGALFDLHVHDADFVRWCLGAPSSVASTGSPDHVTTLYRYASGPTHVVAEGGWDHTPGFPFRMSYTVVFDRATAEFDSRRDAPLTVSKGGETEEIELEAGTGYDGEVRHVLDVVAGRTELGATAADAVGLTAMLEAERTSLERGETVAL